jgi:hypothetical protein
VKVKYLIPPLVFALGLGLLILGIASNADIALLGLTFHSTTAIVWGIIIMLLSTTAFMGVTGGSQPPGRNDRKDNPQEVDHGPH